MTEVTEVSRRRQETRTRLLDAATEVFAEHGLQGASVEQICSRADFTRGAFYSNFSSKEELFTALLRREYKHRADLIQESATRLSALLEKSTDPITPEIVVQYVSEFFTPPPGQERWFALETEFLLLALRDTEGTIQFIDFGRQFRDEFSGLFEQLLHAAGKRFTIPTSHALEVLDGVYQRAQRANALRVAGHGTEQAAGISADGEPTVREDTGGLSQQIAELLFAITTEDSTTR